MKKLNEKNLFPVSIDLLYNGIVVNYDIYDYTATHLLVQKGKQLSSANIEAIKRINNGHEMMYVTEETYTMLQKSNQIYTAVKREELEKTTGYAEIKDETMSFMQDIDGLNDVVPEKTLRTVSGKLAESLEVSKPDVILDLINALAPVDEYLQRHCVNVSLLNGLIGKWMGFPKETIDALVLVGLLHDCGKAALPRQILSSDRSLTVAEFEVVKMHTVHTYNILEGFHETVRQGASGHHEKYNGSGYPYNLGEVGIPLLARITAISDIYDAMTARRSYKDPRSPFFVLSLMKKLRDTELDPMLVELFLEMMPQELLNKPVLLSNGKIGTVHNVNIEDIEFPTVLLDGEIIKTNERLHCLYMQSQ
jgi:HD-GYP domain-containing protein (c-di-GMP phosphodiesterase class II)